MILVKFIILSFFVLGIKGDCPDGFFHAGNACYLISPDEMTEAAAQEVNISNGGPHFARLPMFYIQFCWGRGGYLIEIMTQEEENAIDPFLSNSHQYWIGLSDYAEEGMQTECRVYLQDMLYYVQSCFHFVAQVSMSGKRAMKWRSIPTGMMGSRMIPTG